MQPHGQHLRQYPQAVARAVDVHDEFALGADQQCRRASAEQHRAQAQDLRADTLAARRPIPVARVQRSRDLPAPGSRSVGLHAQRDARVHRQHGVAELDASNRPCGCRAHRLKATPNGQSGAGAHDVRGGQGQNYPVNTYLLYQVRSGRGRMPAVEPMFRITPLRCLRSNGTTA